MRYFLKELVSTPLYLPGGHHFPFEVVTGEQGIWATEEPYLIGEAEKALAKGIGGIAEIDKEQYDELKKKVLAGPSPRSLFSEPPRSNQSIPAFSTPFQTLPPVGQSVQAPAVVGETRTPPIEVPKPEAFKRPRTAKM